MEIVVEHDDIPVLGGSGNEGAEAMVRVAADVLDFIDDRLTENLGCCHKRGVLLDVRGDMKHKTIKSIQTHIMWTNENFKSRNPILKWIETKSLPFAQQTRLVGPLADSRRSISAKATLVSITRIWSLLERAEVVEGQVYTSYFSFRLL